MTNNMNRRVDRLEAVSADSSPKRAFLWFEGQSLDDALSSQNLTLDDQPLMPIRVAGVHPGETASRWDPVFERDKSLLGGA